VGEVPSGSAPAMIRTTLIYLAIVAVTLLVLETASFFYLVVRDRGRHGDLLATIDYVAHQHPWLKQRTTLGTFDPNVIVQLEPNSRHGTVRVNEFGFIANGDEPVPADGWPDKKPRLYRIFVIGGSTVAGPDLTNQDTIAAVLEQRLNAEPHQCRFQAINLGQAAGFSYSVMQKLFSTYVHFQPDLVISLDGYNDAYVANFEYLRNNVDVGIINWQLASYNYFELMHGVDSFGHNWGDPLAASERAFGPLAFTHLVVLGLLHGPEAAPTTLVFDQLYRDYPAYRYSKQLASEWGGEEPVMLVNLRLIAGGLAALGIRYHSYLQPTMNFNPAVSDDEIVAARRAMQKVDRRHITGDDMRPFYPALLSHAFLRYKAGFADLRKAFTGSDLVRFDDLLDLFDGRAAAQVYLPDTVHYSRVGIDVIVDRLIADARRDLPATCR
jgi:hypothetical protein